MGEKLLVILLCVSSIDYIYSGRNCNDFTVGDLLKILYRYKSPSLVTEDQRQKMGK
jgi:hypothetical protein